MTASIGISPLKPTLQGSEVYGDHLQATFDRLWYDVDDNLFPRDVAGMPKLAHYTSAEVAKQIVSAQELWLSSPLFMNDTQELAAPMIEAMSLVQTNEKLRDACGEGYHQSVIEKYEKRYSEFNSSGALDVFIFCLSVLADDHGKNGLLSMWRGYGRDGNGVALVVDPFHIRAANPQVSFIIGRVQYKESFHQDLTDLVERLAASLLVLRPDSPSDLDRMVTALFNRVLLYSLFTKHFGFSEEKEWRVVLLPNETSKLDASMRCHVIGQAGMPEPRCKVRLSKAGQPVTEVLSQIIAGPAYTSPRYLEALRLMFTGVNPLLGPLLVASETPYRPRR